MTIDAFAFPKTDKPEQIQAQHKLAELMMDPAVQTEFTRYKGSVPSRLDANIAVLDRCAKQGQQIMAMGPVHQLPHFYLVFTPDSYRQYIDLLAGPGRIRTCRPRMQRRSSPASSPPRATEFPAKEHER